MCAKTPFQRRNVDVLSEALSVSKLLYDQNTKSWYSTILSLLKYLKLGLRFVMNSKTNLKHFLYTKLKSNYNRLWFLSLHDDKINKDFGNKLRTYRLFKYNISLEPYLSMNQRLSRACIVHLVIKKNNWSYVKTISCVILELRST